MKTYTEERWAYLDVGEGVRYGHYEISDRGRVRHVMKHKTRYINVFLKNPTGRSHGSDYMAAHIHWKTIRIARKVYETFVGEIPDGMFVTHRNGMISDNYYLNLKLADKKMLGKLNGRKSKDGEAIARINRKGDILELYASARIAAKAYKYLNYQSILDRCNHKIKKEWLPDGTTFRWESET